MEQSTFTITELSREFAVTPRTIRYYEDQGLLSPRREGQQRIYAKRDRTRLKLALRGKRLGFSLADIKQMIDMYDTARDEGTQLTKFLSGLSERKTALLQQQRDIAELLAEIDGLERQCRELLKSGGKRRVT
jgi:DNA-binding transcriptional MerR regulator